MKLFIEDAKVDESKTTAGEESLLYLENTSALYTKEKPTKNTSKQYVTKKKKKKNETQETEENGKQK